MKLFAFFPATEKLRTVFEAGILVEWILISNNGYPSLGDVWSVI